MGFWGPRVGFFLIHFENVPLTKMEMEPENASVETHLQTHTIWALKKKVLKVQHIALGSL